MDIQKRLQELEAGLMELRQQQQNVTANIFRQEGAILILREMVQTPEQTVMDETRQHDNEGFAVEEPLGDVKI